MKWFKFYGQDFLTDPKILQLGSNDRSCWITLLCYASINDNGVITFLSEHQLMVSAGLEPTFEEWDRTVGVLERLSKLGMITVGDNGMITVLNWHKRQETNLSGYERVKRWREKKRLDNANDNDRIDKNRIDKIRVKKEESRFAPPLIEEVKNYCLERKNSINAQSFLDFYSSKGWLIGKNKMRDWRAAVRTWENRDKPKVNNEVKEKYAKYS